MMIQFPPKHERQFVSAAIWNHFQARSLLFPFSCSPFGINLSIACPRAIFCRAMSPDLLYFHRLLSIALPGTTENQKKGGSMRSGVEAAELMNRCMIRRGSQVLVWGRKSNTWPGVAFPGGHVEKGESFTESVIREIQEETGLRSPPRACAVSGIGARTVRAMLFCSIAQNSSLERCVPPMKARSGGKSLPISPPFPCRQRTGSNSFACLRKRTSVSSFTAQREPAGLTS